MRLINILLLFIISVLIKNTNSFAIDLVEKYDKTKVVADTGNKTFDDSITSKTLIDQMGFGWNLGNTFDAFIGNELNEGLNSDYRSYYQRIIR